MIACVIMHNMNVDDEHPECIYDQGIHFQGDNVLPKHGGAAMFAQFTQFHHQMRDRETHIQLQMIWLSICGLMLATNRCILFKMYLR